jgi:hypothetical protein
MTILSLLPSTEPSITMITLCHLAAVQRYSAISSEDAENDRSWFQRYFRTTSDVDSLVSQNPWILLSPADSIWGRALIRCADLLIFWAIRWAFRLRDLEPIDCVRYLSIR